jgi:4-amino-4-deoxy-L-arabinose transferase-like glycosyltransferase
VGARRWRPGTIGTGVLWLVPLFAWWVIRWSVDYRLARGTLLLLWIVLLTPPGVATWLWFRQRSRRFAARSAEDPETPPH